MFETKKTTQKIENLNTFIYKNNNLFGVFLYSVATTLPKNPNNKRKIFQCK